jgi:hypothetical protein
MTMTIEIKQLILRAVVEERHDRPLAAGGRGNRTASAAADRRAPPELAVDRDAVIAACAQQVLRELQRGRGR